MIAYNKEQLDNRDIHSAAAKAKKKGMITADEYSRILQAYPYHLYTPNIYVRIGLFLLTALASACGVGLILLIGMGGSNAFTGELIFTGIAAYAVLEIFIRKRNMYMAGVDEALLWSASLLIFFGISEGAYNISAAAQSLIVFLLALIGLLRYIDRSMTLIAYAALICWIAFTAINLGPTARALLPFLVMLVAVIFFIGFTRLSRLQKLRHNRSCLALLRMAALLSFYLAGNYYVVREMNTMIHGQEAPVSLSWLWWALTIITPLAYIARGIQKKDTTFLWTGLALVAAAVFTVRYYYHVLPTELAMIIGGAVLLTGSYWLIRYLHTPKAGFTSERPEDEHILEDLPVEGLIVAETFKPDIQPTGPHTQFGGGSGGGGGAGGDY